MSGAARGAQRGECGVALVIVLIFALLLTSAIATFIRRATVDAMTLRHREEASEAEALSRGGVRLAVVLLLEDRLRELQDGLSIESGDDLWAQVANVDLPVGDDASLRVRIEDAGAKLNLNALIENGKPRDKSEHFLALALEHVIAQMPGREEEKRWEPEKLSRALLDYLDDDDVRIDGGPETEETAGGEAPRAKGPHPLQSLEELRQVEGFDQPLVDAMGAYFTAQPFGGGTGINPNTAPPHVLALLYHGVGADLRLPSENDVRAVLDARKDGGLICADDATNDRCTHKIGEVVPGEIFPPPSFVSNVFRVVAEARVGEIRRSVEAVVDRSKASRPLLLAWRVR